MRSGCVHVETRSAQETDDGLAEPLGGRDREARRRRHRAQHRDPGDRRLLHELEREPARHEQHLIAERQLALEQRVPDQLVERVVATDVFPHRDQLAGGGEARRGVQAAGLVEHALVRGEPLGQRRNVLAATRGPAPTGAQRTSTSSSAALPQMPHDELAR